MGALAATAGCLGANGDGGGEQDHPRTGSPDDPVTGTTPTRTGTDTSETPATPGKPDAKSVREVAVDSLQPGLIELDTPDSIAVTGETAGQSLFLDVTGGEETAPARSEFRFELNGTGHAPSEDTRGLWRSYNEDSDEQYQASDSGWLLFELPATADDPRTARLRWPGGSWQPGETVRERLATPAPSFDVSVTTPETVPIGQAPQMTVTAENSGPVPGRFLLAVNRVGPSVAYAPERAVDMLLEPGERQRWTGEPSFVRHDEVDAGDATTLKFDWFGGSTERDVEFVSGSE